MRRVLSVLLVVTAGSASAQFVTQISGPQPLLAPAYQARGAFQGGFDFRGRAEERLDLALSLPLHLGAYASVSTLAETLDPNRATFGLSWGAEQPVTPSWLIGGTLLGAADWLRAPDPLLFSWDTSGNVGPRVALNAFALHRPTGLQFKATAQQTLYSRGGELSAQIAIADGRATVSAAIGNLTGQTLVSGGAAVRMKLPGTPVISAIAAQDLTDNRTLGLFGIALTFETPGGPKGPELSPLPDTGDVADVGGRVPKQMPIETLGVKGKATLVMFAAPWCGPCQTVWTNLLPIPKADPRIAVRRIDVDLHPAFTVSQNVGKLPTIAVLDKNGKLLGKSDVYDERVLVLLGNALGNEGRTQIIDEPTVP